VKNFSKETVLIIHGTFSGRPEENNKRIKIEPKWYDPGQKFCNDLDDELAKRGSNARCWQHLQENEMHFYWDGANSWLSRARAARRLQRDIKALVSKGWIVHLIGHSHGGNVILGAITEGNGEVLSFFKARAVLLGTPIYMNSFDYKSKKTLFYKYVLAFSAFLWVLFFAWSSRGVNLRAAFGDNVWTQNYAIVITSLMFLTILISVIEALPFLLSKSVRGMLLLLKMGLWKPIKNKEKMKNSPSFMMINSRFDEAFRVLAPIRNMKNPFSNDKKKSFKDRIKNIIQTCNEILATVSISTRTVIQKTLNTNNIWSFSVAGMILIIVGVYWRVIVPDLFPQTAPEIRLSFVFLLQVELIIILAIIFRQFFRKIATFPGILLYSLIRFLIGIAKGLIFYVFDGWLKNTVWGFVKAFSLGINGGPRRSEDITVQEKFSPLHPEDHIYLELPDTLVNKVKLKQKEQLHKFHEVLYGKNTSWTPVNLSEELAKVSFPLIHTSYYEQKECIEKIADWISEPMEELANFTRQVETTDTIFEDDGSGYSLSKSGYAELPNEYLSHIKELKRKYYDLNPDWIVKNTKIKPEIASVKSKLRMMAPPPRL
jgi:hypothetical protein